MSRLTEAVYGGRGGVKGEGGGIEFVFPQKDIDSLFKSIDAGARELGYSLGTSVKRAAYHIARTLGTSTAVSKPKRYFYEDPKDKELRKKRKARNRQLAKRGFTDIQHKDEGIKYIVRRKGKKYSFRAKGKREANKHPMVVIKNRGLAKASWSWGMGWLGKKGNMQDATNAARYTGRKHISVYKDLRGNDPYVKITNSLGYIQHALKGGPQNVNTAIERAAGAMMHETENILRKKLGLERE